jgi:hypothetical protein
MEKELSSEQVKAGNRTYFFDIKLTKDASSKYLQIIESKRKGDEFERHSVMIFEEDITKFTEAFVRSALNLLKINADKQLEN